MLTGRARSSRGHPCRLISSVKPFSAAPGDFGAYSVDSPPIDLVRSAVAGGRLVDAGRVSAQQLVEIAKAIEPVENRVALIASAAATTK